MTHTKDGWNRVFRRRLPAWAVVAAAVAVVATAPATRPGAPTQTPAAQRTGFLYDPIYLEHKTGQGHPERPERLTAIVRRLKQEGLLDRCVALRAQPEADPSRGLAQAEKWITAVHSAEYVARVRKASEDGTRYLDSPDTPISADSYKAAVAAVGGVLAAVDAVVEGKARNAFCAVRPPGHHALKDRAMGFCLFNNVAVAARYVERRHRLRKVLIVDWDVHHGNGTEAAVRSRISDSADSAAVLYFSVHQFPFYPGTGQAEEGPNVVNVPLPAGSSDADYRKVFEGKLVPAARAFRPDFVLVSAGFDAHQDDPLGGMKVTARGFSDLTRIVRGIAEEHAGGRLVSVLEGGYDLDGLAASVEAHLRALIE